MPCAYIVHTTLGPWTVMAISAAQAVATALELAGPGAKVLRIARQGDWWHCIITLETLNENNTKGSHGSV